MCAVLLFTLFAKSFGLDGNDIVFENENPAGVGNNSTGSILGVSKKEFILITYSITIYFLKAKCHFVSLKK